MTTETKASCENCRFFRPNEKHPGGECLVRPPVVVSAPQLATEFDPRPYPTVDTIWPRPAPSDWCGEHERVEEDET